MGFDTKDLWLPDPTGGRAGREMAQMTGTRRLLAATAGAVGGLLTAVAGASAQAPRPWQMGMQTAHSPVQRSIESLNDLVQVIITVIVLFVAGLLAYVIWRFNAKRNPVASRVSHHTWLEVAWTLAPVLILVVIAIPSFRLIYFEDRTPNADMTVKVVGHQWYWEYQYPDAGELKFDSYVVQDAELKPGQLRNLEVDNQLVVPAGKNIRVLTTSADVIHSFFIPSLGVQRYAIPGRTIETWVNVDKPGVYYGQCNQICGTNHSMMPISIHAVTDAEFTAWLETAKSKFAQGLPPEQPGAAPKLLASVAETAR
jgi:cytochrome c oxidase subunit 2